MFKLKTSNLEEFKSKARPGFQVNMREHQQMAALLKVCRIVQKKSFGKNCHNPTSVRAKIKRLINCGFEREAECLLMFTKTTGVQRPAGRMRCPGSCHFLSIVAQSGGLEIQRLRSTLLF